VDEWPILVLVDSANVDVLESTVREKELESVGKGFFVLFFGPAVFVSFEGGEEDMQVELVGDVLLSSEIVEIEDLEANSTPDGQLTTRLAMPRCRRSRESRGLKDIAKENGRYVDDVDDDDEDNENYENYEDDEDDDD
jgi:hypothetical protein